MEKKAQKKKDEQSGKPKRPQTAFFHWLGENRNKIKEENPGISVTEITKKAGEKWKELKDKSVSVAKCGNLFTNIDIQSANYCIAFF